MGVMGVRRMGEARLRIQETETHPKPSSKRIENMTIFITFWSCKGFGYMIGTSSNTLRMLSARSPLSNTLRGS
jgi:hypothetical protein